MCGIVGTVIFRGDSKIDPDLLQRMRDTMQHRGPDGGAQWIDPRGRVGLGHRRLSIIDLSNAATQPMATPDGRFVVTFNGEIYNHAEIRRELEALGRRDWRTDHSDTEVLLFAFREWGIDCLSRFRGMFGFAIWDNQERRLWLVRDRIGIKPIYYARRADRLSFASEIKALIEDPQQGREMDETALFHYLSLMTTPSPMTLFRGVNKLPGGCWLRLDPDGAIEVRRYWDIWDNVVPMIDRSDDDIAAEIRAMLETAVRYRKVSDVPVGVFLSGGIDSSTNAAMFAKGETRPIKTFSIGYEEDYGSYKNELHYARKMASLIGSDHHELRLKLDDLLSFVPTLIHLQDEPIADPVCVPVYYVSKLARDHGVIVTQVGEGADELFCGYPWWQRVLKSRHLSELPMPRGLRRFGVRALDRSGHGDHYFREMLRRAANDEPFFFSGAETFTDYRKTQLLS
ncbi:MAG: asparagine synthase (glutamine-hydrolyzing), partial [Rhodoplanes sp.]